MYDLLAMPHSFLRFRQTYARPLIDIFFLAFSFGVHAVESCCMGVLPAVISLPAAPRDVNLIRCSLK